ncbi:MAG: 7-cyano-7-deazaguanine/7-aminomethyl-7-deazaguanine transporter [Legionellaceae bacterium]|nr:7-cyano-7-deazaguanine/7-aminomethyl-7-deazaguanine transporter [Legionellaceae bacterium]
MSQVVSLQKYVTQLSIAHIILLTLSNVLVQYPFVLFGYHTTWGAFSYPAIFILTDLATRMLGARVARIVIFRSMLPALLISYLLTSYIEGAGLTSWHGIHLLPLRIALACFTAYAIGQLLDIHVFQRYRNHLNWWVAPALSSTVGNLVDTLFFFFIAFYHSSNPFLSAHWPEIATVDMLFKICISLIGFVPVYGMTLNALNRYLNKSTRSGIFSS